jgi:hypothetical protein
MENNISMQQLKQQRLTPAEKFVLETIKGVKASKPDENGNVEWFGKDGNWLFEQYFKNGNLWVSYKHIWSVLTKEYSLSFDEIKQLMNNVMYKYTNNGQLTPNSHRLS